MPSNLLPQTDGDPDGLAVASVGSDASYTWSGLESRARQFAAALAASGLSVGDRWAVIAHNRIEWTPMVLGNLRAGTRYVPINWHLTVEEVAYLLSDSGSRLLVVDTVGAEIGRAAASLVGIERVVVIGPRPGEGEFAEWLADHPDIQPPDDPAGAVRNYTSGTTGRPKGVQRSDQTGTAKTVLREVTANWGRFYDLPDHGPHLVVSPMYHALPSAFHNAALGLGQSILFDDRFDADRFLTAVQDQSVTSALIVPTHIVRMAKRVDELAGRHDLSSLVSVVHGGAPCPRWAKEVVMDWWGPVVYELFGSSEGTGPLRVTPEAWRERPGTVGKSAPTLTVAAFDDDGGQLPDGEVGNLYFLRVDGQPEYVGDPDKTEASRLPGGWFTVGDVGWVDADGYVYLSDRKIDMVISGGANIYPAEVEAVLIAHPAVADCAVFGIPDDEWGEEVKAAVEFETGAAATEDELVAWCRGRLAGFKCPRSVDFHDAMPREATGKLKKRHLRDVYWQGRERPI
ncbi:MAG: acyl-CoA synthetase [Acidimicrobiales bacterium]|jgi:long-chain acyl-CoA synthetase|nr:MAG: acyl-CoA synthetase [Acidimicrobiales bacterium]